MVQVEVDPANDDVKRFIVQHYKFDPERRERRYVDVAAYDSEAEFLVAIGALTQKLEAAKRRGNADIKERVAGRVKPAGHRAQNAQLPPRPRGKKQRIRKRRAR